MIGPQIDGFTFCSGVRMAYLCSKCGARQARAADVALGIAALDYEAKHWGRDWEGSHGQGPEPRCTKLVTDTRFPDEPSKPVAICGGLLIPASN